MATLTVNDNIIVVTNGLHVSSYDYTNHIIRNVLINCKPQEGDFITDLILSKDGHYLAVITSTSKQLLIYNLPLLEQYKLFSLPRSASKIRFTTNSEQVLVADKSGDVLIYNIKEDTCTKLLGHLSLLLDVLHTNDGQHIITSDRDEKIRVSCYPNTYNIQTYCLGHKEFVNHIELLPHDDKYLTSSSGDGCVKFWDYKTGIMSYNINSFIDINDDELKQNFIKIMDTEGVEVTTLPIVHYTITKLNETSSLLAVAIHTYNKIIVYKLQSINNDFSHNFVCEVTTDRFPDAIKLWNSLLFLYDNINCTVSTFRILFEDIASVKLEKKIKMFDNITLENARLESNNDSIKVLYKRKYDNVQEYQERKRQRLEKSGQ